MKEINFIPIFDQTAPGVWDDFMRIRVAAMRENYGHEMSATDYAHYMRQYQDDFARHQYNVAYGAYDDANMVGFIRGYAHGKTAQLECLYVLPDYQGNHIGKRLLRLAESSFAPVCSRAHLIALGHTDKYYCTQGYKTPTNTNMCEKKLQMPACQKVAVFNYTPAIARLCRPIIPADITDASALIANHSPIWVDLDYQHQAKGILVGKPDMSRPLFLYAPDDTPNQSTARSLQRFYDDYRKTISIQHEKHQR